MAAVRPGATLVAEADAGRYRLDDAVPDAALIAALADWCAGADRLIAELRTTGGTLEEVYLELVGGAAALDAGSRGGAAARDAGSAAARDTGE